jgi:putative membrane protein
MDYLIRYAHFLGIMVLFAALTAEHLLTARSIDGRRARLLARIDGIYGLGALITLGAGLAMLFGLGFGKGTSFYLKNGVFHLKLTLFVLVALLSIRQTVFFLRHRRADDAAVIEVPRSVIMLQRVQLVLVLAIPLVAVLMARGVGLKAG